MLPDRNVAIVGYYLLFVIDSSGRPSTGRFIQICLGRRRPSPWFDEDWWDHIRDLLLEHRRPDPDELRKMIRALTGPVRPPLRRPMSNIPHAVGDQGGGHGGGQGGGHDH